MKILMIAPEPFFEPRGTPFSEFFRIQALCKMGHTVDLITYPLGQDKEIKGLKIFRSLKLPFIKSVKTGPSAAKIFLDFFLFWRVLFRLFRKRYDVIHTHEEACLFGAFFNKIFRTPHLYDMHSSLVQQMNNFQFTKSKIIIGFFKWMERVSLRNARSTIVICPSLYEYASTITGKEKLTIIENFIDQTPQTLDPDRLQKISDEIRKEIHAGDDKNENKNENKNDKKNDKKILMYTGTLETYQGIPMLIDSMTLLDDSYHLVLIGGKKNQIEDVKKMAEEKGIANRVTLMGRKEPDEIPYYLKASDVLVSPRILGTNIPLKVYAYLKSGVPVVATDLYTHTQTMTPDISILTTPEPEPFAQGIRDAVSEKGKTIAKQALEFCNKNYNHQRYCQLIGEALEKSQIKKTKRKKLRKTKINPGSEI